jgi:hypothetical protein
MHETTCSRWSIVVCCALLAGVGWPVESYGPTVSGQARSVHATVVDLTGKTTTSLSDTGTLSGPTDARDNSASTGAIPSVLKGSTLHASTIGWADQAASEASIADLAITVGGSTIGADFVMSRASAAQGAAATGLVNIEGLSVNGIVIAVTGNPNQTIAIPGGKVVINEQQASAGRMVVNALHVIVDGVADVAIASSTAAVQ